MSDLISREMLIHSLCSYDEEPAKYCVPCREVLEIVKSIPSIERKEKCEIEKAVKLLSQQLIWLYDDGKISYEVCLELSSRLIDIANMVRGEEDE